ncbi:MAG: nitrate/nitrite transporter NrtS [Actinomycetota bacterium]|nr:nitrate/nitrite transporter NrtS [Actinomycetota bacterium]
MSEPSPFVVGTLLVGINQGGVLASGHANWVVWARVALDYVVPTCVSTMGVLAGTRRSTPNRL